ncbi:IL3RB protein, partial [Chauna torquata]|nr:IL3RB protein [Chauna torquata]
LLSLTISVCNQCIFFAWIPSSGSVPTKSLSCYNDYNSHVTCTWKEHSDAHALLGMSLYRRGNSRSESEEMLCKSEAEDDLHEAPGSYIHWVCRKTVESFGIGVDDIYGFKPNKTLEAHLTVRLFQNSKE